MPFEHVVPHLGSAVAVVLLPLAALLFASIHGPVW